jgi:MFS family permease
LAFVGLLLPKIGPTAALIATFILLVWQGLGSGLTANAWQIMISKVIPGNIRGTFFGAQSAAANLLASLGAFLAGLLLVRLKAPYDFSTLFFIASGLYVLSWFFLNMTRETAPVQEEELPPPPPLWKNIKLILKTDHSFRNFLISRFVTQFGMMAFAFYTVFAVKHLTMSVLAVGVMTSILMITQVIANPLLGRLADKWSGKGVLVLGGLSAVLSAILAIIIKDPNWFVLVFILNGIAATAYWTIGITMSLQFGDERQRPTYVGMSNTLIAPSAILAPLVGGLLADSFGYSVTFITSAVIGLVSVITMAVLVKDPKTR